MRLVHCIRAVALAGIALVLGGSIVPAQQPAGDPAVEVSAGFLIYVRTQQIGREDVTVVRTSDGWTITSTGRTDPPVDLSARQVRVRYDSSWKPVELIFDATLRGQSVNSHTTITGNIAQSVVTQAGQTAERSSPVAADTLLLPSPLWGPFEALARRLRTAPAGSSLPAFALQSPMQIEVGASAEETFSTTSRTIQARRTSVRIVTTGPPIDAQIWADQDGHLLRISIPGQALEVIRDDFASVAVRYVPVAREGDQSVRIPSSIGFSLAATISKPSGGAERSPAVILVGDSGLADRDEAQYGVPIFGQLANALADQGYLVVRYDKRGTGQSGGRPESAGIADYAEDVRAVVRYVRNRKDVDRKRVAVLGYSDGGAVALTAATRDDGITALGLLAAMAVTGAELNLWQVTHRVEKSPMPAAEREQTVELQKKIQTAVQTGKGWETVPVQLRRQADTEWFRSFLSFTPDVYLARVKQPVLILHGLLDTQVPPSNADRFEELSGKIKGRKQPIEVVRVPGVNHLLVPAKTGEVDEYPSLRNAAVSPGVIEPLAAWLKRTFAAVR